MRNAGWFLLGVLTALIFGGAAVQSGWYERPAIDCPAPVVFAAPEDLLDGYEDALRYLHRHNEEVARAIEAAIDSANEEER